jgi:hypothetical protein
MLGMIRPQMRHIVFGNAFLCCFLLVMMIVLAAALGNHRREIERLNKDLEDLGRRQYEINMRYQRSLEMMNDRIGALERKGKR